MLRRRKPSKGSSLGRSTRAIWSSASRPARRSLSLPPSLSRYWSRLAIAGTSVRFARSASGKVRVPMWSAGLSSPAFVGTGIEGTAQPAGLEGARFEPAGFPDLHRAEVRAIRVRVAHPLHHREPPVVEELGQWPESRMQADLPGHLVERRRGQAQRPAVPRIAVEPVRHHGVQAVVAADQLHDHEDAVAAGGRGRPRRQSRATEERRDGRRPHRDQGAGAQ